MVKKSLDISVVNYNAGEFLMECLQSIERISHEANIKVWVVDNASSDDSFGRAKNKFPKFNYIKNDQNLGFGRAHNQVLKKAKSEFVLVLNPDTRLEKGVLAGVIEFMEKNEDVGVATCKIVFEDGRVDLTAHRGFPTPWASILYLLGDDSLYHLSKNNPNTPHEVDAVSGAFFFTRKKILDEVGLFDERFFMYAEDLDLCLRIKQKGYKIMYLPQFQIVHYKGVSSGIKTETQTQTTASPQSKLRAFNAFYETMKIFYKKHYEKRYPFFVNWLVYTGINLRWWLARRKMTV